MPPYRAQLGGIEGSGVYQRPSHQLPIGDLLRAVSEGGTSLIQGAFTRKLAMRRLALEEQRLQQEGELHKAQLEAITAYRTATLGNQQARINAPNEKATRANQQAFGSLQKEFPDHPYVQPDETGQPPQFDPENQQDYVGALKAARGEKAKHDAVTEQQQNKLDYFEKADKARQDAAALREQWKQQDTKAKNVALTPSQVRMRKNDLLNRMAKQFDGDPDAMSKFIGSDPAAKADAEELGIKDFEIKGAAAVVAGANAKETAAGAGGLLRSFAETDPAKAVGTVQNIRKISKPSFGATGGNAIDRLQLGGETPSPFRDFTGQSTPAGNGRGPIDLGAPPAAPAAGAATPPPVTPIAPVSPPAAPAGAGSGMGLSVTRVLRKVPNVSPAAVAAPSTTGPGTVGVPAGPAAPVKRLIQTQAQYDAIRKGGTGNTGYVHPPMTDAEIGARYDVHPSVKRVPDAAPAAAAAGSPPAKPPEDEEEF